MNEVKSLVGKGMSAIKSATNTGLSAISGVASGIAKGITGAITAAGSGVLAFGGYAVKVGQNFESSMSQVIATMGITKDTIQDGENSYEKLADKAKEMGETTKFSASEAADALNYLALAGYDATKACDALPAVLQLAQAGNMDLARTSDLVTDAMSALGIDATIENLTHFGDVLAKTSSKSNASVQQLGEALLVCGGQSKLAGLELEETSTLLGILADNGIKGSEGGTALRNLLKNMYTPTSQASKAMENLGISFKDSEGHLKSAQTLLIETMSALEDLSEADKMQAMSDIFDTRTIAAASATLNNSSERYNELYGEIMKCNGAMEQMAKTQNDNLQGDIYSLKSAIEAVGISISEKLNPKIRNAFQTLTDYVRDLNSSFKTKGFKGFAQSLGDILGKAVTEVTEKVPKFINIGSDVVKSFIKGISDNADVLGQSASQIITDLAKAVIELFPQFITTGGQLISSFADGIVGNLPVLTEKALSVIEWLYNEIVSDLPKIISLGSQLIVDFSNKLNENAGLIVQAGLRMLDALVDGITENLPKIIDTALELIGRFADKISENSDKIISAGVKIVSTLADSIVKSIPKLAQTAKKILKEFGKALEKETTYLKNFGKIIQFVSDNFELFASAATGVFIAFKGYKIIDSITKSIEGLVKVVGGISSVISPSALIFSAVFGLTAAAVSWVNMTKDTETEVDKAIKKEEEYQQKIKESQAEFQALQDNANRTAADNLAPVEHISNLADELETLADATGHVKESDVERVNAILQTMNDALGTDYSLVDGQIQKYDELKKSIDNVIEAKRVEIFMQANEDVYTEAIKSYQGKEEELIEQSKKIEAQQKKIEKLMNSTGYTMDDYRAFKEDDNFSIKNVSYLGDAPEMKFEDWVKEVDLLNEAQENYNGLEESVDSYYKVIEQYEGALGAYNAGDYSKALSYYQENTDKIKATNTHIGDSYAETAVKIAEKLKSIDDIQRKYSFQNDKVKNGVSGYTNAVRNETRSELAQLREDLYQGYYEAQKSGFQGSLDANEETGFKNYSLVKQIEEAYEKDKSKLEELEKRYAETGNEGTAKRIENLKRRVYSEKNALNDVYMRAGADLNTAFGGEMSSEERIKAYVTTFGDNVKNCISDEEGNIYSAMSGLAEYGNFGFIQGMIASENFKNELSRSVQTVRDSAISAVQNVFGIHSPSTVMRDEVGRWILPGIAVGVQDTVGATVDDINSSVGDVASQIESPGMFTQQVELLREFSPKNDIPEITDERITEEMQSQIDNISVTLNADSFISKFESILANIGNNAVPQYSQVYSQVQGIPENRENNKVTLPQNTVQNSPKIKVYIGDTEIKDFVMSTIYEANAVSGGASV